MEGDQVLDPLRLSALDATGLVDGPGLAGLDRLTALASQVLGVPIALSSLVTDTEQFFTSAVGLEDPLKTLRRTPLSHSFCKTVVQTREPLVVTNALHDERVRGNGAVTDFGVIAYAGYPIRTPDDQILGSFCAIDSQPREWTQEQLDILENLSAAASSEIALLLANQDLRRSAGNLQDVLASAHDAYIEIDGYGIVAEWNFAAERLFGWARAEAVGVDLAELIIPARFRSSHAAGLARVRNGGLASRRLELTAIDRTGAEFSVQMTLNVAPHPDGPTIHAFLHGVNVRHDRELALAKERTFLAAVLDSVDVGVAACGSDGRTALFNKAMRRIWGTADEPANVEAWRARVELLHADGVTPFGADDQPLARALDGEPVRDFEMVIKSPGLTARRFLCNGQPVLSPDGRGLGAVLALHDITDRKRGTLLQGAQLAAAAAMTVADTTQDGVGSVIHEVCDRLGWAGGEFWQVDEDRRHISRTGSWWMPEFEQSEIALTSPGSYRRGDGLPGATWSVGRRIWLGDLSHDHSHFTRPDEAARDGLNAALAVPIPSGDRPGVLLFLAEKMNEPDAELSVALESICAHIGRFLERRRAEDLRTSLARTREDFDRVIQNLDDFIWTVEVQRDGTLKAVFSSGNPGSVFGGELPTDADMNAALAALVHPDDQNAFAGFHAEILAGRSTEVECRVIGLDQVVRWVWMRGSVRVESMRTFVDGITSNISRRKQGEIELREERRRLAQAQAIGRVGSWEFDGTTQLSTWSSTLYDLYGVDPARYGADEAYDQVIHPEDRPALHEIFRASLRDGTAFSHSFRIVRSSDGVVREFLSRGEPLRSPDGRQIGMAGTSMDVTEQVLAQRELARREVMLSSILQNSQSLIYVKDLDNRYLMLNEPLLRARGLREEDLIGKTDAVIDPEMAKVWQANDLRARTGEFNFEEILDAPEGRYYYESVKFPLKDGEGRVYATCGISLDVTQQRRAALAMTEARDAALAANAAKSAFLATMSHEIRTPMNAVIGMTDLLLETELDPSQLEYVETVRTSGDSLLAIINDILDFSRIEAGEMELEHRPFDLRRCVEDSLSLTAASAGGIDLVAHVGDGCPRFVRGDVTRLRQVLINLVGNAIKFTREGDVLVLVTADEAPPSPLALANPLSDPTPNSSSVRLSFSVRDTGIGIPPERMDRLFKSFSQVDASTTRVYGGSGLGLAISRAIVQAMGGDITVTSEVGVGSTFAFDLTFERADDHVDDGPSVPVPDLSGRRVLIVDDNETNRRILRLQLEGWGMSCTDVEGPAEAIAAIELSPRFDLAILDMNMPGEDGAQLAGRIRRLPAGEKLPMILLTSLNSRPPAVTDDLFAGFHTKPVRAEHLRRMLGDALGHRGPSTGRRVAGAARVAPEHPLRVLLAEDNLVNQKVAQGMLRTLGHQVDIASDGAQAVEAMKARDYDIVLMDIHMPVMDGLHAARTIREQIPAQRQPQIVAMTASTLPEDRRAAVDAGMDGYLLKPVRVADLAGTLDKVTPLASNGSNGASGASGAGVIQGGSVLTEPTRASAAHAAGSQLPAVHSLDSDLPPAVDIDVLQQLSVDMGADSPEGRRMLIDAYLEQGNDWITDFPGVAVAGDLERIRTIAHTLGSSSALLGAYRLAELLSESGRLARTNSGSSPELVRSAEAVSAEYARVAAMLSSERLPGDAS